MKNIIKIALLSLLVSSFAMAQGKGLGIGLEFSGIGITGKYWLSGNTAAAATVTDGGIAADYLLVNPKLISISNYTTPVHYGLGAGVGSGYFALRVPVGFAFYIPNQPMDVYTSVVPAVDFNGFDFGVGYNFGIRYYF